LGEQLLTKRTIAARRQPQYLATNVRRTSYGNAAAACLLLPDVFLHLALAFLIHNLSRLPRFAKQRSRAIGIGCPKHVRDARLRPGAQGLVIKSAGIRSEIDEQILRVVATFFQKALGFRIFFVLGIVARVFGAGLLASLGCAATETEKASTHSRPSREERFIWRPPENRYD